MTIEKITLDAHIEKRKADMQKHIEECSWDNAANALASINRLIDLWNELPLDRKRLDLTAEELIEAVHETITLGDAAKTCIENMTEQFNAVNPEYFRIKTQVEGEGE